MCVCVVFDTLGQYTTARLYLSFFLLQFRVCLSKFGTVRVWQFKKKRKYHKKLVGTGPQDWTWKMVWFPWNRNHNRLISSRRVDSVQWLLCCFIFSFSSHLRVVSLVKCIHHNFPWSQYNQISLAPIDLRLYPFLLLRSSSSSSPIILMVHYNNHKKKRKKEKKKLTKRTDQESASVWDQRFYYSKRDFADQTFSFLKRQLVSIFQKKKKVSAIVVLIIKNKITKTNFFRLKNIFEKKKI